MKYSVIQLSSVSRDKQRKIAMKGEKLMAVIGAVLGDIAGSQLNSTDQRIWITNIASYLQTDALILMTR